MTSPHTTPNTAPAADVRGSIGRAATDDLLTEAGVATAVIGLDGSVIDADRAARQLFTDLAGDDRSAHDGLAVRRLLEAVPRRLFENVAGGVWRGEIATDGGEGLEATVVVRHDAAMRSGGTVAVMCRAVSPERDRVAELEHRLTLDALTGLPNRAATIEFIDRLLRSTPDTDPQVAVLMIDIDGLQDVNDALGCEVGDRLISSIAKRLHSAVRPSDVVGRVGNDEFAVVCPAVPDLDAANELAARLQTVLTGRMTIRELDLELDVSVSVGASVAAASSPHTDAVASELIGQAGAATHAAKQLGRGGYSAFRDEFRHRALERTELAAALSKAVRNGELHVEYQPIFSAVSEQAEAAEALVRWAHSTRGRIEARDFIAIAEQTGVITELGNWVLEQAVEATRTWIESGTVGPKFAVHVNVSRRQLADPGFVDLVVELLRSHGLRPPQLVLEASETTFLGDEGDAMRAVQALRRVGVRIALDNFGTGSNALSLLTDVGADVLKLDGSLALPAGTSETDTRVARALVLLAHALSMEVVAERVSSVEQLRRLRAAGCDMVQGHLVGEPTSADRLATRMSL